MPFTGLELMLYINQAEYLLMSDFGAGAIVVVHPADRMPFPEDEGNYALPGRTTSYEIREVDSMFYLLYLSLFSLADREDHVL